MLSVDYFDIQTEGPDKRIAFRLKGQETQKTLTVERTPDFEFIEKESERGAHCYEGPFPSSPKDTIKRIVFLENSLNISTAKHFYSLNLNNINATLIADCLSFFLLINQDQRFILETSK